MFSKYVCSRIMSPAYLPSYIRVIALLAAAAIEPPHDPPGYREPWNKLLDRFFEQRTPDSGPPSTSEFISEMAHLRRVLECACFSNGCYIGGVEGDELLTALLRIDAAYWEAVRGGLIDDAAGRSPEWRRSRPSPRQCGVQVSVRPVVFEVSLLLLEGSEWRRRILPDEEDMQVTCRPALPGFGLYVQERQAQQATKQRRIATTEKRIPQRTP